MPSTWILIVRSPDNLWRHIIPESDEQIPDHARSLATDERFAKVSAITFKDLETAMSHNVVIGYIGNKMTTVIIPESSNEASRHVADLTRAGEKGFTVSLADYIEHGPDALLTEHNADASI